MVEDQFDAILNTEINDTMGDDLVVQVEDEETKKAREERLGGPMDCDDVMALARAKKRNGKGKKGEKDDGILPLDKLLIEH